MSGRRLGVWVVRFIVKGMARAPVGVAMGNSK